MTKATPTSKPQSSPLLESRDITLSDGQTQTIRQMGAITTLKALNEMQQLFVSASTRAQGLDQAQFLNFVLDDPEGVAGIVSAMSGIPESKFSDEKMSGTDLIRIIRTIYEVNDLASFFNEVMAMIKGMGLVKQVNQKTSSSS